MFEKFICAIRGHRPYKKLKVEEPPQPRPIHGISTVGQTIAVGSGSYSYTSGYLNAAPNTNTIVFQGNGLDTKMCICGRCNGVYWISEPNKTALTSVNNIPELKELNTLRRRELWEQQERETNKTAARLYKQYQVALKMGAK